MASIREIRQQLNHLRNLLACSRCGSLLIDPVIPPTEQSFACRSCTSKGETAVEAADIGDITNQFRYSLQSLILNMEHCSLEGDEQKMNACQKRSHSVDRSGEPCSKRSTLAKKKLSEKRNTKGETILHRAVLQGDYEKCRVLINDGHSVNCRDNANWTPLHEAAIRGDVVMLQLLMENAADPSAKGMDGGTPLHDAIKNDSLACAMALLEYGVDKSITNDDGKTAEELCTLDTQRNIFRLETTKTVSVKTTSTCASVRQGHDIVVSWTGFPINAKAELIRLCRTISQFAANVSQAPFSEKTTHLVCSTSEDKRCQRTLSYMRAIVLGCYVLNMDWLNECVASESLVDVRGYLIMGTVDHPTAGGVLRSLSKTPKTRFLAGWQFYLVGRFEVYNREKITTLLTNAGAKVLRRCPDSTWAPLPQQRGQEKPPQGIHILYDRSTCRGNPLSLPGSWPNEAPFRYISTDWLMDSIDYFQYLPLNGY